MLLVRHSVGTLDESLKFKVRCDVWEPLGFSTEPSVKPSGTFNSELLMYCESLVIPIANLASYLLSCDIRVSGGAFLPCNSRQKSTHEGGLDLQAAWNPGSQHRTGFCLVL